MLSSYVDSLISLSYLYYGIPLLMVSTLTTVLFVMLVLYPLGKMMNSGTYKRFPVIHMMPLNNYAFRTMIGFPLSMVVFFTIGINLFSFVNVIAKVFM